MTHQAQKKKRGGLFCSARVKSRRLWCSCTFTLHVVLRGVRTCKPTESAPCFHLAPLPAFLLVFIPAANTKGATNGKNLSSFGYIIASLKQQFTGCFWSFLNFSLLQQDACLYFCLIDLAFCSFSSGVKNREDVTPLARPHVQPTI